MNYRRLLLRSALLLIVSSVLSGCSGCGDNPEVTNKNTGFNPGGSAGSGGGSGSGGNSGGKSGNGGSSTGGTINTGATGGTAANPCEPNPCMADEKCQANNGTATCIKLTCADLNCSATEECIEATSDAGATCHDISCTQTVDCPAERYCNGEICVDDQCVAGEQHCEGSSVVACASDGSGESTLFTCSSATFASVCVQDGAGKAHCSCEGDWDCPANTICDAGLCVGTGLTPTCKLPPLPFSDVPPTIEIQWGGTNIANPQATGSPFPNSAQVVMTPIVANLDDDNGDGLINERDYPEIVFLTFCASEFTNNGVLRGIHGGGPNKGKDYFATLGATTWHEGEDPGLAYSCANATINSTAAVAVGDLDYDGVPEIIATTEGGGGGVQIFNNKGDLLSETPIDIWVSYANPGVSLANIDGQGFAEIVVGKDVFTIEKDAMGVIRVLDHFTGSLNIGENTQGPVSCIADIGGDSRQEIIAGSTAYTLPKAPPGVTKISECAGPYNDTEYDAFCAGQLLVFWDGQAVNGEGANGIADANKDGFCAIADVLGADGLAAPSPTNPLDGIPEVVLINQGNLIILRGTDGVLMRNIVLQSGNHGGPPNIDDFDGDGFPEIGTAFATKYVVVDLQDPSTECPAWPDILIDDQANTNPARAINGTPCSDDTECGANAVCNKIAGTCSCLHNGWTRRTEDGSSQVTGSSVFDFNGDGAAEVIYNDECYFRIYNGQNGEVYTKERSPSRTRIEYPVVADVDNDGNAEIVFATSNESGFCDDPSGAGGNDFNNGLEVWGDATDNWVSARRIWNQHAYHVTNITEGGKIPLVEPKSWLEYNGRKYNTYRSNPRSYGVAPDLVVTGIQVSSPDATCGQLSEQLTIVVEVKNQGDLRVGPGVQVAFFGQWTTPALNEALHVSPGGADLVITLATTLEPGESTLLTTQYAAANNSPGILPDSIRAVVDSASQERECIEDNNEATVSVDAGTELPDLRLVLGSPIENCPSVSLDGTLFNDGSAPASNVLVRYYAGDPNQGGQPLAEQTVAGPIQPGQSVPLQQVFVPFPENQSILIYGVADPANVIAECNDANNKDDADQRAECSGIR